MGRRRRSYRREENYERKIEHREWFTELVGTNYDPANNQDVQLLALPNMTLKSDDCTVLRTRGYVNVDGQALGQANLLRLVLGMTTLPAKYADEISNLPNPLTQDDSDDWFVWQPAVIEASTSNTQIYRFEVDSKAMRKMESDTVVKPIIGIQSPLAAFGSDDRISIVGVMRVLVGY